jgi:hypothetical protein
MKWGASGGGAILGAIVLPPMLYHIIRGISRSSSDSDIDHQW